jgi:hypothetical protein
MNEFAVKDYISFFKLLAGLHKQINSFYIMDINELESSMRTDLVYPALVLVSITGGIDMNNEDNILNRPKAGFIIIDHVIQVDDFDQEVEKMDMTFKIATDLLSKIKEISEKDQFPFIDIPTIKFEMMGPVFDNDWGWLFSFDLLYQIHDLIVDPDVWLDEPKLTMSGH